MLRSRLSVIAAVADNGTIGKDNDLPWKIPADLRYFKEKTTGNAIVMGRRTFESFGGRVLPNRLNIVVSSTLKDAPQGVLVCASLTTALYLARIHQFTETFIIGGRSLFQEGLKVADRFYLTEVHQSYDGDVKFPKWERTEWEEVGRTYMMGEPSVSFVTLDRRAAR